MRRRKTTRLSPFAWTTLTEMGTMGFSARFISVTIQRVFKVKLSVPMVYYHLSQEGIKLSAYRNGETHVSKTMAESCYENPRAEMKTKKSARLWTTGNYAGR